MPPPTPSLLLLLSAFAHLSLSAPASSTSSAAFPCISSGDQTAINARFSDNGAGHVVQLCRGAVITATDTVRLTADDQELSTEGYPTGDDRGVIRLAAGTSANTTVFAKFLDGVRLRNIIVDGNRESTGYTGEWACAFWMSGGLVLTAALGVRRRREYRYWRPDERPGCGSCCVQESEGVELLGCWVWWTERRRCGSTVQEYDVDKQ